MAEREANRPGAGREPDRPGVGQGSGHWHGNHRRGNRGRPGDEFEGVLGLVAGWTMGLGRGRSTRLLVELAGVGPEDRVVDVGCGPGQFLLEAAGRGATAVGGGLRGWGWSRRGRCGGWPCGGSRTGCGRLLR
jgi:hypothetical protein